MTGTPGSLPETPPEARDALSDLLDGMRLSGVVMFTAEFRDPWSVTTPGTTRLKEALQFGADHMIPFHVVADGGCWIEMPGAAPVWIEKGDVVCMPFGDSHRLFGRQETPSVALGKLLPKPPWGEGLVVRHGGDSGGADVICGFVQCDELIFDPILRHLPILIHARPRAGGDDGWLASTIERTIAEVRRPAPGSRGMAPRLTEVMFVEILRRHMQELSPDEVGWFAAYNNPIVGAALRLLHAAPFDDWSVDKLAKAVGASRTVLAGRFNDFLDAPPMQYLAHWRLRLAAQRLKSTDLPVKTVADDSGYESEAAFNRAFKRCFGLPPGDWRRRGGGRPEPAK
jgi:AraC family transcriptional regulator, alkane utilization regulator